MLNNILFALAIFSSAYAQDSVNIHGFHLTPDDGELQDPLRTWRAEENQRHTVGVNILGEYAYRPLVRYSLVDGEQVRDIEVRDLAVLNLGLFYSPHERVGIAVTAPAYLAVESATESSGIGLGDFRASVPIGLIMDHELSKRTHLGLSVVPHLDIPGFYRDRYFRAGGISGGGIAALTVGTPRTEVSANFGVQFAPEVEVENLTGNERLIASLAASYLLTENVALRGEFTIEPPLSNNEIPWSDTPSEITISARGHANNQLGWVAGASSAITKGAGAATFRAFLGLDLAFGARDKKVIPCPEVAMTHVFMHPDGSKADAELSIDMEEIEEGEVTTLSPGTHVAMVIVPNPPKSRIVITETNILLLEPIYFDFNKDTIRFPDSTAILAELVDTLTAHPEITKIQVATGTDVRGDDEYNLDLSARRAMSVVNYLLSHGIHHSRLTSVGYGEKRLKFINCDTEECHEKNRYAEFLILDSIDILESAEE